MGSKKKVSKYNFFITMQFSMQHMTVYAFSSPERPCTFIVESSTKIGGKEPQRGVAGETRQKVFLDTVNLDNHMVEFWSFCMYIR